MQKLTGGGLAGWQLELVFRRLLLDLCADVPGEELASLCGLSRSYFSRAFKVSTGISPHRWLVRQRIARAAELLEWTNESISAIALNCGFSDQSHLTRAFQATVGASPGAWRRQRRAHRSAVAREDAGIWGSAPRGRAIEELQGAQQAGPKQGALTRLERQ